ncbi:GM12525 [Drosophila sechellia]|uniref:GM12525 n=1 Tax=Drosophila sechellia TaxID=7238 RepID=B4I059_DROSE|nr:GM12525 [Drosophila sechellia]
MICHKEHYAARLPPDVLKEMRAGRGNRPDYWVSQRGVHTFHFTCPFCQKPLLLCQKDLIEHLTAHMGESRHYCSNCNLPQNRLSRLLVHTASCGPGAKPLNSKAVCLPMIVQVCHICQFMQYSKENMDRHLTVQHGLTMEELQSVEREELALCDTMDVPSADSNKDGSAVGHGVKKNKPKSKASAALSGVQSTIKKKKQQKNTNSRFMKMVKKSVSLLKREKEEQDDQNMTQADEESEVPQLQPPPPEIEPMLVVNECLMSSEMDTDLEEVLDQSVQHRSLMVDEKPVTLLSEATEQLEPTLPALKPTVPSAQEDDSENKDQGEQLEVEAVVDSLQSHTAQTATSMLAEVSLAELAGDVLDGIGSDTSDYEMDDDSEQVDTTNKNGYRDDDDDALTDEWVDLETANRNSKSGKSIFRVFNRFCSRLNKFPRSSRAVLSSNGSQDSDSNANSDDDNDDPDPSELMPTMQPLEPEPGNSSTSTGAKSLSKRVENVAFQKSSSDEDQNCLAASYYCVQPGCTFLFSDELEGLENHFALEHPLVRWSGKCDMCHQKLTATETNLTISEELRHMRDMHMKDISTLPPSQPSAVESPAVIESCQNQRELETDPVPGLPKLRVRRFTGDRLVVDSQAEKSQPVAIVVSDDDNQRNGMLRDLLVADPRPPNQQLDLQAAGLGEFLCAKPDSPSTEPAKQTPVIVGYPSGLGLKISQVFSRTQISADSLLSPVVNNPLPEESPSPAAVEENRNRFKCMATNCNFVAHKLMFMREHIKFHSYSFSSTGHLNCAYCSHVAIDVDDYLRHGVIIHDLAPRSELESSTGPPSVSQKIRDMLSQRESGRVPAKTQITLSDVILGLLECTGYSEDKLYACPQKGCIVRLTNEQFVNHLRYHIRSTNQGSDLVKCKFCTKSMLPPALRTHLQQYHARHSIFCGICLATSVNQRIMIYHMRTVHSKAYCRPNAQLQFVRLPAKPDASKKSVETEFFVAVVEKPFGNLQMQNFQRKLFDEMDRRAFGHKDVLPQLRGAYPAITANISATDLLYGVPLLNHVKG